METKQNWVLNINKPSGCTSHDVVDRVRRVMGTRKVGHCGTLDPNATGVLLVCVNRSTKFSSFFMDLDKEYVADMILGKATSTHDVEGDMVYEKPIDGITEEKVRDALNSFVGHWEQIPPMTSAVKVGGKKLYQLARKGITVERKPKPVQVYSISIETIELPLVRFRIKCSKGTYVRTLCNDVGEMLGCGAYLADLVRSGVGSFNVSDAVDLDQFEKAGKNGTIVAMDEGPVYSLSNAFFFLPSCILRDVRSATPNALRVEPTSEVKPDMICRILDPAGRFLGLGKCMGAALGGGIRVQMLKRAA